jgi:hypothetical protein
MSSQTLVEAVKRDFDEEIGPCLRLRLDLKVTVMRNNDRGGIWEALDQTRLDIRPSMSKTLIGRLFGKRPFTPQRISTQSSTKAKLVFAPLKKKK